MTEAETSATAALVCLVLVPMQGGGNMLEQLWIVIENTPGYLPDDDDPPEFDTYAEAVEYLNMVCREYAEDPDGNYSVDYGMAADGNYAAAVIHDHDKMHDLGRWIAVSRVLEDLS